VGSEVDVEPPKGKFMLPDDTSRPLVFVAPRRRPEPLHLPRRRPPGMTEAMEKALGCDGAWPADHVQHFRAWIDAGSQM
jgi:hypothetical protein